MRCSPDSSTTNESSAPRLLATRAVGSRYSEISVESNPGKSPPPPVLPPPLACRRRHEAIARPANNARITAAGSHQFCSSQSISEPLCATGTGFFTTTGFGSGAGAGVGGGVAVFSTGAGAGGGAGVVDSGVLGFVSTGAGVGTGAGLGAIAVCGGGTGVAGVPSLRYSSLSSLFFRSSRGCASASCSSKSLTRPFSACASPLAADSLPLLLAPLPAPGVTRRKWPLDAEALLPRQASI